MGRFKTPDVEENVGCNLIPMIDIMFLLLLFFMLGADMTQRELEDVVLPKADQAKEDSKEKTDEAGYTTINIFHDVTGGCAAYGAEKGICSDTGHWTIAIRGKRLNEPAVLAERLEWEAKQELEPPDPANPAGKKPMSKRKISIRADAKCLYEQVQRLIEACGKAGLYKIEVGAARPSPDAPPG
jgi:biopolymer transport protein ExbD